MIINKPEDLYEDIYDVTCYKCKGIMKAHPMSNISSDYFTNCKLHSTAEAIIDAQHYPETHDSETKF